MSNRQRIIAAVALALAVVAIVARVGGLEGQLTFVVAAVALIGLAWLLGEATEQAGGTVGPRASALLNASFGNLPEIVIVVLAINAGLNDIARASIIGSVTGNVLLILGLALFLGGWRHGIQKFNARLAATNSSMLVLAVIGMGVPTLFQRVDPAAHDAELLSVWTARGAGRDLLRLRLLLVRDAGAALHPGGSRQYLEPAGVGGDAVRWRRWPPASSRRFW